MPGLELINQQIEGSMQDFIDGIELDGMTKLVRDGSSYGINCVLGMEISISERIKQRESWKRSPRGVHPNELDCTTVWMPTRMKTVYGGTPNIVHAYTPIDFELPLKNNETEDCFKIRIRDESMRAVESVRQSIGNVNAYFLSDLERSYKLSKTCRQSLFSIGDSFLDSPAKDSFIPRMTYNLCLFEIENK